MEISNMSISTQQTTGGTNVSGQVDTKTADSVKHGIEEEQTMTKKTADKMKKDYTAVSKDGDTLTLSESSKDEGDFQKEVKAANGKENMGSVKMTDAALAKCSSQKLRQLLQQGQISRQQYEKAMKKASK